MKNEDIADTNVHNLGMKPWRDVNILGKLPDPWTRPGVDRGPWMVRMS